MAILTVYYCAHVSQAATYCDTSYYHNTLLDLQCGIFTWFKPPTELAWYLVMGRAHNFDNIRLLICARY